MSVSIQNLVKSYGKQNAVDGISFEANPGKILGFLGPNGAGKSTTMKIATGYLPATSGQIVVCGTDVATDPLAVRKKLGYLPEHNPLYLDMYVHEYLGFIASLHGFWGKTQKSRVGAVIEQTGLGREQNKRISDLSKGYRQRVGLAQALVHDPEVLILDEPTTGLDPNQIVEIRKLIKETSASKTVIFSTHIMQEVQALCDNVVIINEGKIAANDSVDNLKTLIAGHTVVTIVLDNPIDVNDLRNIQGVNAVETSDQNTYKISVDKGSDIRADLFSKSKDNDWNLLELKQEETSLEEVFHELTQK